MPPFHKHPGYLVRSETPFNGGAPLDLLRQEAITPPELFFVRNHGDVPSVDPASYRLAVDGLVDSPLNLTLDELRERFARVEVTATLQCAGNRRLELIALEPVPGELPWGEEAISTAVWSGVRLRDLLAAAGVSDGAAHVAFQGLDPVERQGRIFDFGGSIPLGKALSPEVLLADSLNGAPLPSTHGFPLRVVAPGYIGARSVKWLQRISVQETPSDNYFQAHAYKLFPPDVRADTVDWSGGKMLGEMNITSVICRPAAGATVAAGSVAVQGYAIAGGERSVARVELSADGGATWRDATLQGEPRPFVWTLWEARLELPAGRHQLVVRATDSAGTTQPASVREVWNFKGYMNNAWHRVDVEAE